MQPCRGVFEQRLSRPPVARQKTVVDKDAGERRIAYGWVWLAFLGSLFVGAGMMLSQNPTVRGWGLVFLLLPLAGISLLLVAFYVVSRRQAKS